MKNLIQITLMLITLSLPCLALAWGWSNAPTSIKVNTVEALQPQND
jgi:hypothetical protein